jgi:DnaJ-class molecular chaperone
MDCKRCDGRGYFSNGTLNGRMGCSQCNGTGQISEPSSGFFGSVLMIGILLGAILLLILQNVGN